MKKLLPQCSAEYTNTGSSELVMAVFATGKKAKQPVESSVNNEEAVQLEIGADHLVRLEEEEKAPEATLNGERNDSDWMKSTKAFLNTQ